MTSIVHEDQVGFIHKRNSAITLDVLLILCGLSQIQIRQLLLFHLMPKKRLTGCNGDFCLGHWKYLALGDFLLNGCIYYINSQRQQYKLMGTHPHILSWVEVHVRGHHLALCCSA